MSVKIMSAVWEAKGIKATDKIVLLALADHADESGVCYPSIRRIADRAGLSDRAAQVAISRLAEAGWVRVEASAGPRGCNRFTVEPPRDMHPRRICTPQDMHPINDNAPAGYAPPQDMHPAGYAPEPSVLEKKEKKEGSRKRSTSIPPDAVMSERQAALAADRGLSDAEAKAQFQRFRDRALSKGDTYANWDAAWRNWLSSPFFKPLTGDRNGNAGQHGNADPTLRAIAIAAGMR